MWILTAQEMALQVLGVQVSLSAMRAGEFAISVLLRDHGALSRSGSRRSGRSSRRAGQNTTASLGANNMGRLLSLLQDGLLVRHQRTRVGRRHAGLGHDATGGHGTEHGGSARRRGRNGLRVRRGDG